MISIIICTVNDDLLEQVTHNISKTVGVPYELIVHNNIETKWGLCKVYNYCAEKAKYPFLCFIHEDVLIHTVGWGEILTDFAASTHQLGVIGFAGSRYVPKNHIDWEVSEELSLISCRRYNFEGEIEQVKNFTDRFADAIILDGMFLFVRKEVWNENRFDEQCFEEFHLYDSDFTLNISFKYNNYVCSIIDNTHFCRPKFNPSFCLNLLKFKDKWGMFLPFNKFRISLYHRIFAEFKNSYRFVLMLIANRYGIKNSLSIFFVYNRFVFFVFFMPFFCCATFFKMIFKFNRIGSYMGKK